MVRHFNKDKPVYLLTDASRLFGLGYALGHLELDSSGKEIFKIVKCGSKGLTPTQQRYSTIELECLAIVWAILKCAFYLRGLPSFQVYTDHKTWCLRSGPEDLLQDESCLIRALFLL